ICWYAHDATKSNVVCGDHKVICLFDSETIVLCIQQNPIKTEMPDELDLSRRREVHEDAEEWTVASRQSSAEVVRTHYTVSLTNSHPAAWTRLRLSARPKISPRATSSAHPACTVTRFAA